MHHNYLGDNYSFDIFDKFMAKIMMPTLPTWGSSMILKWKGRQAALFGRFLEKWCGWINIEVLWVSKNEHKIKYLGKLRR